VSSTVSGPFDPRDGWSAAHLTRGRRWFLTGVALLVAGFVLGPFGGGLVIGLGCLFVLFGAVALVGDRLSRR
jgi:hypothetical protein